MSITFENADKNVQNLCREVVAKYHEDLKDEQVSIGLLFAIAPKDKAGEPMQDAVKLHGYPCAAVIKITPYKKRVQGIEDAEITIDRHWWDNATEEERVALLDHELTHLIIQRDQDGAVKTDDCHRPKLKMRLHDGQLGVFKEIIERHGQASVDAQVSKQFVDEYGQLLMEFASVG